MKQNRNDAAVFRCEPTGRVFDALDRFFNLLHEQPFLLQPVRKKCEESAGMLSDREIPPPILSFDRIPVWRHNGFYLLPTVEKTTLLYDGENDCFIKIIHNLRSKDRVISLAVSRSGRVNYISKKLLSKGIRVPAISAYGNFKTGGSSFYLMDRVGGKSLYRILVNEKKSIPFPVYLKVIESIAEVHRLRYWFGDLRISHVFVGNGEVSGFVDIDSVRRNFPYRCRNIAKDLAGLNSPDLPLSKDEKMALYQHYIDRAGIKKEGELARLVEYYTHRRWGLDPHLME